MTMVLDTIRSTITRHQMLKPGDIVVVAVSGGPDSMALLHALTALRDDLHISLHVAHLNHGLRPGSAEDSVFVRAAARSLGLPATTGVADARRVAAEERRSLEEAARQVRYEFLAQVAASTGAQAVATAHTQDDQVETVLMRLMDRGPWETLAGMPPVRPLGAVRVVRPLLDLRRNDILAFLNSRGAQWRDDPTNRDLQFRRNWVRHAVIPVLTRDAPDLARLLGNVAQTVAQAEAVLADIASQVFATTHQRAGGAVSLPLDAFAGLPRPTRRRLVRSAFATAAGTDAGFTRVVEDEALGLLSRRRPGEVLIGPWALRRSYDAFVIAPAPPPLPDRGYDLTVPGETAAAQFGVRVQVDIVRPEDAGAPGPGEAMLDADVAGGALTMRPWRAGDRIRPLGMKGKKKVQDLLVDQKVPRWERGRVPLIVDAQDRVLWVVDQRIADDAKVTPATKRVLRLRVVPMEARVAAGPFA